MRTKSITCKSVEIANEVLYLLLTPFCFFVPFSSVSPEEHLSDCHKNTKVPIVYDNGAIKLDSIVANLLAEDNERVTSYKPEIITDISKAKGNLIVGLKKAYSSIAESKIQ
jgi:hypothetical protein